MRTARQVYDSIAKQYDYDNSPSPEILQLLFSKALEYKRPVNALDVCCGTGTHSIPLAKSIPSIRLTGIDVSKKMLEKARGKMPGAQWVQGDFFFTDIASRAYDLVMAIHCLHLINWKQFVLRCNRIVSELGQVFIVTGDRQDYSNIYYNFIPQLKDADLLHYPRVRQLRAQFEQQGFETKAQHLTLIHTIADKEDVEKLVNRALNKTNALFHLVPQESLANQALKMKQDLLSQLKNATIQHKETLYAIHAKRKR
ncbi:MAG: class I SAM-dependent methyltransferase [Candidatus Micrarchaeia archaeon]